MSKRRARFRESKDDKSILIKNKERLHDGFDILTDIQKFDIHKESLLEIQSIFYRVIERHPDIFKANILLSLRKRRIKNAVGSENDLHYPIVYKPHEKGNPEEELYNEKMVIFHQKFFLLTFSNFFWLTFLLAH